MTSVYWNVALFDFGRISYRCSFVARSNIDVRMYTKRVANAVLTVVEIMSRKYGCGEFHKTNEQPTYEPDWERMDNYIKEIKERVLSTLDILQ